MYSNKILNFQEFTTILNVSYKKVWKLIKYTTYLGKAAISGLSSSEFLQK